MFSKKSKLFLCMASITLTFLLSLAAPVLGQTSSAMDRLYELAQKEKGLVFNVGTIVKNWSNTLNAFEKRFPMIKLTPISVRPPSVPPRIITEAGTGRITIDAARGSISSAMPLEKRNLIAEQDWSGFNIAKEDLVLGGKMVLAYEMGWIIVRNTELVSEAEQPRTWEDLLNPRWEGKIISAPSFYNIQAMLNTQGEEKTFEYARKLAGQQLIIGTRSPQILDKVARGEAQLGQAALTNYLMVKEKSPNIPLDIVPISPQPVVYSGIIAIKGSPNPNAAKLLLAWFATPEAKEALKRDKLTKLMPPDASPEAELMASYGIKLVYQSAVEEIERWDRLQPEIAKVMGLIK